MKTAAMTLALTLGLSALNTTAQDESGPRKRDEGPPRQDRKEFQREERKVERAPAKEAERGANPLKRDRTSTNGGNESNAGNNLPRAAQARAEEAAERDSLRRGSAAEERSVPMAFVRDAVGPRDRLVKEGAWAVARDSVAVAAVRDSARRLWPQVAECKVAVGQAQCFAVPVVALDSRVLVSANDKAAARDSARLRYAATASNRDRLKTNFVSSVLVLAVPVVPKAASNAVALALALEAAARPIARPWITTSDSGFQSQQTKTTNERNNT